MSGASTDPPWDGAATTNAAYYLGICDECRHVQTFTSAESRTHWEQTHQHIERDE